MGGDHSFGRAKKELGNGSVLTANLNSLEQSRTIYLHPWHGPPLGQDPEPVASPS